MDVQQQTTDQPSAPRARLLRWGEYLSFLTIIPGTVLALSTGQFAFAASPLTLSLWLNWFRRFQGDRNNQLVWRDYFQEAVYRYDAALSSTQHDRMDFVLDHAGQLPERDRAYLMQVLQGRIQDISKKHQTLTQSLVDIDQSIRQGIAEIQALQAEDQTRLVKGQQLLAALDVPVKPTKTHIEELSARFEKIQSFFGPQVDLHPQIEQIQSRIVYLESQLEQSQASRTSLASGGDISLQIQERWQEWVAPFEQQLAQLRSQLMAMDAKLPAPYRQDNLEGELERMHQRVTDQLKAWEEWQWEQGYKFQRVKDNLASLQTKLDQVAQLFQQPVFEWVEQIRQAQMSQLEWSLLDQPIEQDLEQLRQRVGEIQGQLSELSSANALDAIAQSLDVWQASMSQTLADLEQFDPSLERSAQDQLNVLLTPLLQYVSDCDEKLANLGAGEAHQEMTADLEKLESQIRDYSVQTERLQGYHLEKLSAFNALHIQLAMIRCQTEELSAKVVLELEQIPFLIDNQLRQRFPQKL